MNEQACVLTGIVVSPGIAAGRAVYIGNHLTVEKRSISADEAEAHVLLLQKGLAHITAETEKLVAQLGASSSGGEAAILEAHLLMLQDPTLCEAIIHEITQAGKNTAWAVDDVFSEYIQTFETIDDEYMRQRSTDLSEIRRRLLAFFSTQESKPVLRSGSVVVAEDLGPAETLSLDRGNLSAIILEKGGRTSHTAVLARALGIPALVGVAGILDTACAGENVIVDADAGKVFVCPAEEVQAAYMQRIRQQEKERRELREMPDKPVVTQDGQAVEVWANVGGLEEAKAALQQGAQGIGLFRTEFLYMGRQCPPSEEEQEQVYREMLSVMGDRPVVVRTLDIGADKRLPYFNHAPEENPALGCRAIRLCFKEEQLFRAQLRALLKASTAGNLWIMFPMIAVLEELRKAKALLEEVRQTLLAEGHRVSDRVKVGMMVEIPAAAINADFFAPEADFFSIGTNDLLQYTFAADRQNNAVDYLYQPLNSALLRLLQMVVKAGHAHGIPVGICGEMAADVRAAEALIGLGIDELSMSAASIPKVKKAVLGMKAQAAAQTVKKLIDKRMQGDAHEMADRH